MQWLGGIETFHRFMKNLEPSGAPNRGQRMGIARKEPAAIGLFAVDRDSIARHLRCFPTKTRGHRQCVPASRVCDFAADNGLLQLARTTDPNPLVRVREVGGEAISPDRRLAWIQEHHIVRHQREQPDQIACIDGTDPRRMNLADYSFIGCHLLPRRRSHCRLTAGLTRAGSWPFTCLHRGVGRRSFRKFLESDASTNSRPGFDGPTVRLTRGRFRLPGRRRVQPRVMRIVTCPVTRYNRDVAIKTFRHKGLERFFTTGGKAGIQARHADRLRLILGRLSVATAPGDMRLPGLDLHELRGPRIGTWAVTVNGNWRLTFAFEGRDVVGVDYEDCH
jgi:proteic killer suppression protein